MRYLFIHDQLFKTQGECSGHIMIVWLAGTPGVGKTTVGRVLSRRLGVNFADLPELVKMTGLGEYDAESDSIMVTAGTVRRIVERHVDGDAVLCSHVVVKIPRKKVVCIVLRLNPLVLIRRLKMRGYSSVKVLENVESEFVGTVYLDAVRALGRHRVYQLNVTGLRAGVAAGRCLRIVEGGWRGDDVDWLRDLHHAQLERLLSFLATSRLGTL